MPQRFNILLFDGFSNHCLANMIEPLRAANNLSRTELYHWRFCSIDAAPVTSSSGLVVTPDTSLAGQGGDVMVVMPSYGFLDLDRRPIIHSILAAATRHGQLAGLDTGSWLLARGGLLDGYRATIHWDEFSGFEETFPNVHAVQERFVIDRDRMTCSGAMAAFDLALFLIAKDHGGLLSMEVSHLLMSRSRTDDYNRPLQSGDARVNRAINAMQANLEVPLPIRDIAKVAGCSQKNLEALFQEKLRATPQALYRRVRLNLARKLAEETDQSISEIATRVGYENASAMARAFKSEFGQSPSAYRRNA